MERVAPLAGAWIEISYGVWRVVVPSVAPLAGAWIEIPAVFESRAKLEVAPLAGAWIEIFQPQLQLSVSLSLPSRERGLK